MDYRLLEEGEDVKPGDWWVYQSTGPDDRMTFTSPNWFTHPTLGRCHRIDAGQAKLINDWVFCGYVDVRGIHREVWEDF